MSRTIRRRSFSKALAEIWDHVVITREQKLRKTKTLDSEAKDRQNQIRRSETVRLKKDIMEGKEVFPANDKYSKVKVNSGYQYC
ncbi:hypothetical protein ZPAH1_orf00319 [Aeromonas phage ZPAH1]|nr:hypothetical protein ASwh1_273 [Aeromonas phage Aswh_1]QQG34081.1 hypothetical protein ZPAH1_orf00319 [Aeromonas phage ZPAH1]